MGGTFAFVFSRRVGDKGERGVRFVRMPCSVRAVFRQRLVWLAIICRRPLANMFPARGRPQACSCSDYMSIKHLLKERGGGRGRRLVESLAAASGEEKDEEKRVVGVCWLLKGETDN